MSWYGWLVEYAYMEPNFVAYVTYTAHKEMDGAIRALVAAREKYPSIVGYEKVWRLRDSSTGEIIPGDLFI